MLRGEQGKIRKTQPVHNNRREGTASKLQANINHKTFARPGSRAPGSSYKQATELKPTRHQLTLAPLPRGTPVPSIVTQGPPCTGSDKTGPSMPCVHKLVHACAL